MVHNIKFLGAYGGKSYNKNTTSILVREDIAIDAGNILSLGKSALKIDHIFITHSHLDHIYEIPFLIDNFFACRDKPLRIYGLKKTLESIKKYIFNWEIWPDFSEIELIKKFEKAVIFKEIKFNEAIELEDIIMKPFESNHTVACSGYIITNTKINSSIIFTSDTYINPKLWDIINHNVDIKRLIIDVSFPSKFTKLSKDSKHLTPLLLKKELKNLRRDDVVVDIFHLKPSYYKTIVAEIDDIKYILNGGKILEDNDIVEFGE